MRLYQRGKYWWLALKGKRVSTEQTDRVAAELWAARWQRRRLVLEAIDQDPELAAAVEAVLAKRRESRNAGHIYGILHDGLIKIGFTSNDPLRRLRVIQTHLGGEAKLVALRLGKRSLEGLLHGSFRSARVHGEWFRADHPGVAAWVEKHRYSPVTQGPEVHDAVSEGGSPNACK